MSAYGAALVAGVSADAWLAAFVLVGARGRREEARFPTQGWQAVLGDLAEEVSRMPPVRRVREEARRRERRASLLRDLPQLMDVVSLGLMSGLSFDASLELYCDRYETPTAHLFLEALTSWRLGVCTREEALEEMADQMNVGALRRFSAVVTQALHFGSPLALSLERQSHAIREEQRSEVEEEIERVPVRMLIPLGTLIVPAMLLAILGPLLGGSVALA